MIDITLSWHRRALVLGFAFAAMLGARSAFAQITPAYDPDFAPTAADEQSKPAAGAPEPAPQPATEPRQPYEQQPEYQGPEPAPGPLTPLFPGIPRFQLIDRPDPTRILSAEPQPSPQTRHELSVERYQKVRAAIERGEDPEREDVAAQAPSGVDAIGVELSTAAPMAPPPEVELPAYGTSLSVTGRKVIGVNFSEKRFLRDQKTTARPKTTNLIEINQQLQLRMQGKVGPKITVNVDYDDTKENQQDISVVYQGDPNEVVQNVSFGDIDLSLPATEFVSYNKQLFGIRADVKYKGFKATVIGSRTKGTTKTRQFIGNTQFATVDVLDTAYIRRQYYDVSFGVSARLPIQSGTERIFLARQDPAFQTVSDQELTVDDIVFQGSAVNTSSFTGRFTPLVAGQDYTIDYAKGIVQFRNQLLAQYVVAIDYVDALGNALNTQTSSTTIAGGGTGRFKIMKTASDVPIISSSTETGFKREMKTVYSIGQTSIVRDNGRGNFILRVLDANRAEVGSSLNPVQKYPDTIEVDFENGNFRMLQPFSVSNSSPTTPDPDLYSPTPITKRVIRVEYNFRLKTFLLEPNLVVQSELVLLDNIKLNRNVDYFIDYEAGFITFFNPDRIGPSSEINITFEVAPFAGVNNDTLMGGRVSHDFGDRFSMGSTLLYQAGTKSQTVPQVTELARSLLVYEFDAQAKRISIGDKVIVSLAGEFAQSRQNLNLNSFALIDNMEGIKQEEVASTLASQWQIAANPSATISDPTQFSWASEDVKVLDINPNAQAGSDEVQKVLAVTYNFAGANPDEVSIVFPFSISGVDLSQRTILEVVMQGDNSNNQLQFKLGAINEDADNDGVRDTEDTNNDGILQPSEDINGWSYNYAPIPANSRNFGANNGLLDTEDLDRNGVLNSGDFTGDVFGYGANAGNTTLPDTGGSNHANGAIDFSGAWRTLQIPLNISTATASRWTNIKQLRLSIRRAATDTGKVRFARIAVVGNTWQRGSAGDPGTAAGAVGAEKLTVTPINSVDNQYTPIYNAGGDAAQVFNDLYGSVGALQRQSNTKNISEQALQMSFTDLSNGATVYTKRVFSRAIDISQHRYFTFLINPQSTNNQVFFLRAGSEQSFFEVRVPMTSAAGWRKIRIKQVDTTGRSIMDSWAADTPGVTIVSSGTPTLQQVGQLVAGVYGQAGGSAAGTVYLNEIHLAEPVTRVGTANKLQADIEVPGWGTLGGKHRYVDRSFQTPTSVLANQDRIEDNAYLNFNRLSWMPMSFTLARTITDTPSTVQTGTLSNLVNLLQQGKVTTWNGSAQANLAYGAYPRLNFSHTRNRVEYDVLTRLDDKKTYSATLQYGVPWQSRVLPRTIDANAGWTASDVTFGSSFARAQPGNYDNYERGNSYGARLTFTPWTGSSFNPAWSMTKVKERRTEYLNGLPQESAYPKSFQQSLGFSSNFRLLSWLNPQVNYQMDTLENNVLTISTFVVGAATHVFRPGDIKTVNRNSNGSISLPITIAEIFPRTKMFRSMNVVSGYQLQDGDTWNNVDKDVSSQWILAVRDPIRNPGPAAQRVNQTLRDTWNSTQRWSPLEGYDLRGRLAAFRTLSVSNNYVKTIQRSEVTGTKSKTISTTLPDTVASLSQMEQLLHVERWAASTQLTLKYARRITETVGSTINTEDSFGTDLRSIILRGYDASVSYNLRTGANKDLRVNANSQRTRHEDTTVQVTFGNKFRFTPKVDYTQDSTYLGTGVKSQDVEVITPSLLMRADLALPSGLRLPGSAKPLLFTNRIIWTTTLSMAQRRSPVTVADNSRLASMNTSADYEIAKNLRMTLNGSLQRLWHRYLKEEDFFSYAFGSTLTFQF